MREIYLIDTIRVFELVAISHVVAMNPLLLTAGGQSSFWGFDCVENYIASVYKLNYVSYDIYMFLVNE